MKGSIGCRSQSVRLKLTPQEALEFMEANTDNQSHFIVQRFIPDLCDSEYRFYVKWYDMKNAPHMLVKTWMECKDDHTMNTDTMAVQHIPLNRINLYGSAQDSMVMELAPTFINTIVAKLVAASYLSVDVTPLIRLDICLYEDRLYLNEIEFDTDITFFSSCHHDPLIKDFGGMFFYNMCQYWSSFIESKNPLKLAPSGGGGDGGDGGAMVEEEKYPEDVDTDIDSRYTFHHFYTFFFAPLIWLPVL